MRTLTRIILSSLSATLFAACVSHEPAGPCHIRGVMANNDYDGVRVFVVPMTGPKTAPYVDSTEIEGGRFEFNIDTVEMAVIRLDYHHRDGIQELLVVTEPGDLYVTIDTVSSAHGTPQNDSLQRWKEATMRHNAKYRQLMLRSRMAYESDDSISGDALLYVAKQQLRSYKDLTRGMAASLPDGPLRSFLESLYPKTYKRKLPDGSVKEIDADE